MPYLSLKLSSDEKIFTGCESHVTFFFTDNAMCGSALDPHVSSVRVSLTMIDAQKNVTLLTAVKEMTPK